MQKSVFFLVAFVLLSCLTSLVLPSSSVFSFFFPSSITAEVCLALTIVLGALIGLCRIKKVKDFFASTLGLMGTALISVSLVSLISPTYFGLFNDFVPQANLITFLVLGVSFSIACLEIPHKNIIRQLAGLRHVLVFNHLEETSTELRLWVLNHTPVSFHSL